jgi:hypothetical protein
MRDVENLRSWIRVCLWVCAICTTLVPLIYSFSPWWRSLLGRAFMIQAISFAMIVDITLIFAYWKPDSLSDILVRFWVDAILLTLVAGATLTLAITIWLLNHRQHHLRRHR